MNSHKSRYIRSLKLILPLMTALLFSAPAIIYASTYYTDKGITSTEPLFIDSNVGIGVAPTEKLHVNGNARASQFCLGASGNCISSWPSGITVKEADGSPSVTSVTELQFDSASGLNVTDLTGGKAKIALGGAVNGALDIGPARPVQTINRYFGTDTKSIDYQNGTVYVASGNYLYFFNDAGTSLTGGSNLGAGSSPYDVKAHGQYVYVVSRSSNELRIFDESNIGIGGLRATISTGSEPFAVDVQGHYAYVANYSSQTLQIFDVSSPTNPTLVSTFTLGTNEGPRDVFVDGQYAYVACWSGGALRIIDISDPTLPSLTGALTGLGSPETVYVQGNFAYLGEYGGNLRKVDIKYKHQPASAGTVAAGSVPRRIVVQGKYAYTVGYGDGHLRVFDVDNMTLVHDVAVSGSSRLNDLAISGTDLYVAEYTSVRKFDISGANIAQLAAGGLETGSLDVFNDMHATDANFSGGVTIDQSLQVHGDISVVGALRLSKGADYQRLTSNTWGYNVETNKLSGSGLRVGELYGGLGLYSGDGATAYNLSLVAGSGKGVGIAGGAVSPFSGNGINVSSGNYVGIGTASPTWKMHVYQNDGWNGSLMIENDTWPEILFKKIGGYSWRAGHDGTDFRVRVYQGSSIGYVDRLKLNYSGDFDVPGNVWGAAYGWVACGTGECACPDGYFVTRIWNQGTYIYCSRL